MSPDKEEQLFRDIEELKDFNKKLYTAIAGDDKLGTDGLVQKMEKQDEKIGNHETRIKTFEDLKQKGVGAILGLVFVSSLIGVGAIEFIRWVFTKH